MVLYKQTQYGIVITVILGVILLSIVSVFIWLTKNKQIPWLLLIIVSFLFLFALLSFYKLTITITKETIKATFGIGIIKRSLNIKAIDYNSIEKIKIPALYGIGIRLTPYGWLYNVSVGHAIKIKSNTKTFLVGTEDFEKIHSILNSLKIEKQ